MTNSFFSHSKKYIKSILSSIPLSAYVRLIYLEIISGKAQESFEHAKKCYCPVDSQINLTDCNDLFFNLHGCLSKYTNG